MSTGQAHDNGEDVLVRFHHVRHESARAYLLSLTLDDVEGVWLPKSQITHIDTDANEVWLPLWLAEEKGLEYE